MDASLVAMTLMNIQLNTVLGVGSNLPNHNPVIVCGECGQEYKSAFADHLMTVHLKVTGHCQYIEDRVKIVWQHNGYTQKELEQRFFESLTREDADLMREYGVRV